MDDLRRCPALESALFGTCGDCTSNVTNVLKALAVVGDVNVSLAAGEGSAQYDENQTSADLLKSAVKRVDYKGGCCG
ncbi:MAG: heavy-metal-associated domain-containing protein [Hyphomicrobiaceae bacterium]